MLVDAFLHQISGAVPLKLECLCHHGQGWKQLRVPSDSHHYSFTYLILRQHKAVKSAVQRAPEIQSLFNSINIFVQRALPSHDRLGKNAKTQRSWGILDQLWMSGSIYRRIHIGFQVRKKMLQIWT